MALVPYDSTRASITTALTPSIPLLTETAGEPRKPAWCTVSTTTP
jgi:hypothetical protein